MDLDDLLHAVRNHPDTVTIPEDWTQGRACYGGLMAGLLYEAMRLQISPERKVRSLAITFVAPAQADVPITFAIETLREGKGVSSLLGRAVQNGQVVTMMQGSFGAPRASAVALTNRPAAEMLDLEAATELPFISGVTPQYIRHLAIRWGVGAMPFTGTPSPAMGGWMRLRNEAGPQPLSEAHLLVLVDAWPPALLPHLTAPAPGSSLTWTIEFVHPAPPLTTLDWCRYCAVIEHARDGYGHTAAGVWSASGELLAISRQTVTVFA
ncbi:thioesterase family protein [Pseudomonas sp. dw_358]|uniref:acyl-CoA thioesterase n=1 Tax=Pseudomonas sp. dw_358 TaxID=2720083 RepID=UPI001BD49EDD|nr:thioesterase family protein [Pseudomonas sp. dw_358]